MRREYILGVLFLGGMWGVSEATLGNALYSAHVSHASVPLTTIGFVILTIARAYFPHPGTATLIACCAMLYKFLNAPFFACHLLGIVLMGVSCDLFLNVLKLRRVWLAAALAAYTNYAAFALMITYVARYDHWVQGGFARILTYIVVDGSMAAIACAVLVPLGQRCGAALQSAVPGLFVWRVSWTPRAVTGVTAVLWMLGIVACFLNYAP